jgi:hypothetical protein
VRFVWLVVCFRTTPRRARRGPTDWRCGQAAALGPAVAGQAGTEMWGPEVSGRISVFRSFGVSAER